MFRKLNKRLFILFLLVFLCMAVPVWTKDAISLDDSKVEPPSSTHLIAENKENFTEVSNFLIDGKSYVFEEDSINLTLRPGTKYDEKESYLEGDKQISSTLLLETLFDKYKFTVDLSTNDQLTKDGIQEVYFDIIFDYPWGIHVENNHTILFGPEHTSGKYNLSFDDLIDLGYDVKISDMRVTISHLENKDLNLDPIIKFSTAEIESGDVAMLTSTDFVIAYCDDTNNDASIMVYNTTGAVILAETDVGSSNYCYHKSAAVSALNSTDFVIAWFDQPAGDITAAVYNTAGTAKWGPQDINDNIGSGSYFVDVSALNSTDFVVAYFDDVGDDITFEVYNVDGSQKSGPTDADESTWPPASVAVEALNSTDFVIAWYDGIDDDITFSVYNYDSVLQTGPTDVDTSAGSGLAVSIAAFNETDFVIGWRDQIDQDATYTIYNVDSTLKLGPIDADKAVGNANPSARATPVVAINGTTFVMAWHDDANNRNEFSVVDYQGNNITGPQIISEVTFGLYAWIATASRGVSIDMDICGDNFIVAYGNKTTEAVWETYNANGTLWDGICPILGPTDTCTCPGLNENWMIDMSDYCNITTDCDLGTGKLNFTGTGWTNCTALVNTTDLGDPGVDSTLWVSAGCEIYID